MPIICSNCGTLWPFEKQSHESRLIYTVGKEFDVEYYCPSITFFESRLAQLNSTYLKNDPERLKEINTFAESKRLDLCFFKPCYKHIPGVENIKDSYFTNNRETKNEYKKKNDTTINNRIIVEPLDPLYGFELVE